MELERIYRLSKNLESIKYICIEIELLYKKIHLPEDIQERMRSGDLHSTCNSIIADLKNLSLSNETVTELKSLFEDMQVLSDKFDELEEKIGVEEKIFQKHEDWKDWRKEFRGFFRKTLASIPIWQDRITNELRKRSVIELYLGTLLNPEKLKNGCAGLFDNEVVEQLSELQKADLNDGCNCILLKAWTPASMIIMRAIESSLRSQYELITGIDPFGKNWGTILKELHGNPSVSKKILNYFDYLKDYRNKIQHPEVRFDQSETEDMLSQAIHIFNRIYS